MSKFTRGVTIIEVVVAAAIIAIMGGYSTIKYFQTRENLLMDSDKVKIMATVARVNMSSRNGITPRYIKFVDEGIVVARVVDIGGTKKIEFEFDSGTARAPQEESGLTTMFNCFLEEGHLPCPVIVFEDDTTVDNKREIPADPQELELAVNRKANGFVMLKSAAPEKPFTVYTFDKNGVARNRIVFSIGAVMKITVYRYVGTGLERENILDKSGHTSVNIGATDEWELDVKPNLPWKLGG